MLSLPKRYPGQVVAACDHCKADLKVQAMRLDDLNKP
jgi:hypothetical protein